MPTIILQFPVDHEQNNGSNFPCVHCGQYNLLQTNDMKEEEMDIKEKMIAIKEEDFDFDFEMDEYILHKDPNLYPNMFSPISNAESEDLENNESFTSDDQDENFDVFFIENGSRIFLKSCSI